MRYICPLKCVFPTYSGDVASIYWQRVARFLNYQTDKTRKYRRHKKENIEKARGPLVRPSLVATVLSMKFSETYPKYTYFLLNTTQCYSNFGGIGDYFTYQTAIQGGRQWNQEHFFWMGTGAKHPTKTASIQLAGATITKRPKRFGKIQTSLVKLQEGPYIYSRTRSGPSSSISRNPTSFHQRPPHQHRGLHHLVKSSGRSADANQVKQ
jgi:hypothetical protein